MKKRLSAAMALILLLLTCAVPVSAAGDYDDSGYENLNKLSQKEIATLLGESDLSTPSDPAQLFDREPSLEAPYEAGKLKDGILRGALNRLNVLRRIAGLPAVELDAQLCENAQYGALLLAVSEYSHKPSQPGDMDDAFYETASAATSASNIRAGEPFYTTLNSLMKDSDEGNISRLGHRRWQLNPALGKVGFGYVLGGQYKRYTTEMVFDKSAKVEEYNFIAWPASGDFPTALMDRDTAWSITLNPLHYQAPELSELQIRIVRDRDRHEWRFSGAEDPSAWPDGKYLNVELSGYGVANCIIFRPDLPEVIEKYDSTYTVEVTGLRDTNGIKTQLSYQVTFFNHEPMIRYSLNVQNGSGGGSYWAGDRVTVTAGKAPDGTVFRGWSGADELELQEGNPVTSQTIAFSMPARSISLTPVYEKLMSLSTARMNEEQSAVLVTLSGPEKKPCFLTVTCYNASGQPIRFSQMSVPGAGEYTIDVDVSGVKRLTVTVLEKEWYESPQRTSISL